MLVLGAVVGVVVEAVAAGVVVADCWGRHKSSKSTICPSGASMKQIMSGLTFCARRGEGATIASDRKRAARRIFLFQCEGIFALPSVPSVRSEIAEVGL